MICETCHGTERRRLTPEEAALPALAEQLSKLPCRDCDGNRLSHCCDGDHACPDTDIILYEGES